MVVGFDCIVSGQDILVEPTILYMFHDLDTVRKYHLYLFQFTAGTPLFKTKTSEAEKK